MEADVIEKEVIIYFDNKFSMYFKNIATTRSKYDEVIYTGLYPAEDFGMTINNFNKIITI